MIMLMRFKRDLTMAEAARALGGARVDLLAVADMVASGAKVLDVGCGDGELLQLLAEQKGSRSSRATPIPTLRIIPTTPSIMWCSHKRCRRRGSRASCSSTCCA